MQEKQAQEAMVRLSELFPKDLPPIPEDTSRRSTVWNPQELSSARRSGSLRFLQRGWKLVDGFLQKGQQKARIPEVVDQRIPGELGYNPHTDAPAIRWGGVLIEGGKWAGYYWDGVSILDRHGSAVDVTECPICHGLPYHVRKAWDSPFPNPRPWEAQFTYCPRCVTPAMLAENERRVQGSAPAGGRRR